MLILRTYSSSIRGYIVELNQRISNEDFRHIGAVTVQPKKMHRLIDRFLLSRIELNGTIAYLIIRVEDGGASGDLLSLPKFSSCFIKMASSGL